jgi:hypothetical protein
LDLGSAFTALVHLDWLAAPAAGKGGCLIP